MCDKAVEEDLCLLEYVPDWFVKQQHVDLWGDDDDYYDDDKLIEWYEGHWKCNTEKQRLRKNSCPLPDIPIVWWTDACQKTGRGGGGNR